MTDIFLFINYLKEGYYMRLKTFTPIIALAAVSCGTANTNSEVSSTEETTVSGKEINSIDLGYFADKGRTPVASRAKISLLVDGRVKFFRVKSWNEECVIAINRAASRRIIIPRLYQNGHLYIPPVIISRYGRTIQKVFKDSGCKITTEDGVVYSF